MLNGFRAKLEDLVNNTKDVLGSPLRFLGIGLFSLLLPFYARSQHNVSGVLTKIPSMQPGLGRVTLENTLTQQRFSVLSDSTTGNYSLSVPSGTYKFGVEFQPGPDTSHFIEKVFTVNNDTMMNFKSYPYIRSQSTRPAWSTFPILLINKILTNTYSSTELEKLKETMGHSAIDDASLDVINKLSTNNKYDIPLRRAPNVQRYFPRRPNVNDPHSMPAHFGFSIDRARDSVLAAGKGKISYREASTDSTEGLSYVYKNNNEMSVPGALGVTTWYRANNVLYKVLVEINKTLNDSVSTYTVDLREIIRSLGFWSFSPDDQYVTYSYGNQTNKFHPDEKHVIELTYSLDIGTDMSMYRTDSLVTRDISTSVSLDDIASSVPLGFSLGQNYPNPYNSSTTFPLNISRTSDVDLGVYDALGRLVQTLVHQRLPPGEYNIHYLDNDNPSGVYFFKVEAVKQNKKYTDTKKGVMVK